MPTYTGTAGPPNTAPYQAPQPQLDSTVTNGPSYPGPRAADDPRNAPPIGSPAADWQARTPAPQNPAVLNPNQSYIDAFNAALARQRGAIDSSLAASLGSMGHRRDLAAQTITKGSADVQQALANQNAFNAQAGKNADQGLIAGAAPGANANSNLYSTVINSARSTERGAEPLLQLGAQANYDTGAAQLQSAALQSKAAIDAQQAQFAASQGQMQQQERYSLMEKGYTPGQITAALAGKAGLPQLSTQATDPYYQHALFAANIANQTHQSNAEDTRVSKASNGAFATRSELDAFAHQNPMYGWAARGLAKGGGHAGTNGHGQTLDAAGILGQVTSQQVIGALYANGLIGAQQVQQWVAAQQDSGGGLG